MKSYNIKNHLFFDGYDLNEENLKDITYINVFLQNVNNTIFNSSGNITLIPYFDGKVQLDGGISGIIIGDNFHFTCHTFCFKKTVFIDYFGDENRKEMLLNVILETFKTSNYDLGSKSVIGNFGKHIILSANSIPFSNATKMVNAILNNIEMTPISKLLINKIDDNSFDILQPIAESHISLHQHDNMLIIDVFSCKNFETGKVIHIINGINSMTEVNRGIQYK